METNQDIYLSIHLDILHNLMLFPHIFIFKSKSSCFFFLLKIMTSVLATLREILFACSHWIRNLRSLLTTLFIFLIESLMFNRQVSSANWKISEFFIGILRSLIKIKKSKGPRTKPWGKPLIRQTEFYHLDRTWTNPLRYL